MRNFSTFPPKTFFRQIDVCNCNYERNNLKKSSNLVLADIGARNFSSILSGQSQSKEIIIWKIYKRYKLDTELSLAGVLEVL